MSAALASGAGILPVVEWDFDAVPDSELVACCYWEYARESGTICELRRLILRDWEDGSIHDWSKCGRHDLSIVWCDYFRASELLPFLVMLPPPGWQEVENSTHAHIEILDKLPGRAFPVAWQSLSPIERTELAKLFDRKATPGVAIRCPGFIHPRHLYSEYCRLNRRRPHWDTEGQRLFQNRILYPAGEEHLLLEIEWGQFSNQDLVQAFDKWVKENRPQRVRGADGRGRGPRAIRADLRRLGAMRLLAQYTPKQLCGDRIRPPVKGCYRIWETKQFAGAKWRDDTKWRDARREANRVLHKLFPRLAPGEKPLSWLRKK